MFKRTYSFIIVIALLLVSTACSIPEALERYSVEDGKSVVKYSTKNSEVEFTFPYDWIMNTELDYLDLYVESGKKSTGVFIYNKQDFSEDTFADDTAFQNWVELLFSIITAEVNDLEPYADPEEYEVNENSYYTVVYTGEYQGVIQVYRFTGIQFHDSDIVAVILQDNNKSIYKTAEPIYKSITESAQVKKDSE